jgi:hypothetical protein
MSVNETVTKTVQKRQFSRAKGGGGHCGTNWPTDVAETATLYLMKIIDSVTSCDPYMGHTLRLFFIIYFTITRKQRIVFKQIA